MTRILLIEDNPGDARLIKEMLAEEKEAAFDLEWKDDLSKGLERLAQKGIDVVLLDLNLPDSHGFNTLTKLQAQSLQVPVVIITGLDDETLAIRAVRKGAQDYLVKGQIDSRLLVRSIRYAIARRLGEERRFTLEELKQYDGKEGRPAYIAAQGKVYDVTASRMWKNGVHSLKHHAGNDLTEDLLAAPHSEELLVKFHIVGELTREKSLAQKLARRIEELHLHPIMVHFSIAYSVIIPLFAVLYLYTGTAAFEAASYYMLLLGFLSSPLAAVSGVFSWKVTYEGKMTRLFFRKIVLTALFVMVIAACFVWRALDPNVLTAATSVSYVYLALLASLVPLALLLGYYGGEIVYA